MMRWRLPQLYVELQTSQAEDLKNNIVYHFRHKNTNAFHLTLDPVVSYQPLLNWYCRTCLIRHTKGPGKCVGLYRMSEYSDFSLVNRNTFGP